MGELHSETAAVSELNFGRTFQDLIRFSFGDSAEMADELLEAVLAGEKTGTTWAGAFGRMGGKVGRLFVIHDSQGRDRALVEVTQFVERQFNTMDDTAFAASEGEGDRSLAHWRQVHEAFFTRQGVFTHDMPIWCCSFKLLREIPLEADQ
jgi:uncharacterized protein YhfF